MATIDLIKDILSENLDIAPEKVCDDSTFTDLEIDSLDTVELLCTLEDRLGFELGDPEGINTVGELCAYIDQLKEAK